MGAGSRWDAVALLDALPHVHGYLVQTGPSRWTLHVERDRDERDLLTELLGRVASWLAERSLAATVIEVAGREQPVHAGDAERETARVASALLAGPVTEQASRELPLLEHDIAGLLHAAVRPRRPQRM